MKHTLLLLAAFLIGTLAASAQGTYPERIVFPGIDHVGAVSAPWMVIVDVNPSTGIVQVIVNVQKVVTGSPDFRTCTEEVANNPSSTSEYYRHGDGKAKWWVRIDTDGKGKMIRVWGQDEYGRFWILKGWDVFPLTPSATPGDLRPAVQ